MTIKPCNLFDVGGRVAAIRQSATELAQICARAFTESLINMTGEGVKASAGIEYPAAIPRFKGRHIASFNVQGEGAEPHGMIHLENALCSALLERACGGQGIIEGEVELLTLAESRFAVRLVTLTLELISRSIGLDEPMQLSKEKDLDNSLSGARSMFLMKISVSTSAFSGNLSIWLPGEVMRQMPDHEPLGRDAIMDALGHVPVPVTATLSRQRTSLGNVLSMKPGDILPLRLPGTAEVRTGNRVLFQARVVSRNGQLALQLQDAINGEKEVQP